MFKLIQAALLLLALLSTQTPAATTVRYQHTDILGSVVAETDAAANIISRSHYEPFGKRSAGDKASISYTGHLQDEDLNLIYMQQRYYDPVIGRFYSNDPVDTLGHMQKGNPTMGFNRYAYANNNPYKYTDPDGEFLALVGMAIGAYTAYSAAQDLGLSKGETALAVAAGAAIGAITGGSGSAVVATGFKQGAVQAIKSTTTQAVSTVTKGGVVGGVSAGTSSAAVQLAGSDDGSVDVTKVGIDTVKGVIAGASGGVAPALLGESTVVKAAAAVISTVAEENMDVSYQKEEK